MSSFFFFNDTATTEIYTLSLHDALPICEDADARGECGDRLAPAGGRERAVRGVAREQRGLGAVARPPLGDAAQRVGVGAGTRAPGGGRVLRGGGGARGGGATAAPRLRRAQRAHRR